MAKHIATGTPTQVAHPAKAALRTAVAYALAAAGFLALAIPVLIDTLGPYLPESWAAWLTGAVAFLVALATLITRLMALAAAQDFLEKIGLGTGVDKEPDPDLLEDSVAAQFYAASYPVADEHGDGGIDAIKLWDPAQRTVSFQVPGDLSSVTLMINGVHSGEIPARNGGVTYSLDASVPNGPVEVVAIDEAGAQVFERLFTFG